MRRDQTPSGFKLKKLKELRLKKLETDLLEVHLKGQDHYIFMNERGKAQVVSSDGNWITEHIKTAILKFNYEVDKTEKMLIRDFSDQEIIAYEKIYE
tara:strand:- start:67 stop:357 length:291 start_codon:yes stop_codon:yes gene_type:complete